MVTKNSRVTPKKSTTADDAPTSVSEWKRKSSAGGALVRVPSGMTARLKRIGMQTFVSQGMIPNSLMPYIKEALSRGKPGNMEDINLNQQVLADMMMLVDVATMQCMVEPKVHPVPVNAEDRDPNLLYIDEMDEQDKIFIFNYSVGGTTELESFRPKDTVDVGPL